jgi:hypothetical protein
MNEFVPSFDSNAPQVTFSRDPDKFKSFAQLINVGGRTYWYELPQPLQPLLDLIEEVNNQLDIASDPSSQVL